MTVVYIVYSFVHNGVNWQIVRIGESYFARQGESDTGPYSSFAEAEEFITTIKVSS